MGSSRSDETRGGEAETWVLDLGVAGDVAVPDGGGSGRDAFAGWLWGTLGDDGLEGVSEGDVDVEAAAAAGLIESPLVLDAAAAPADRDWVAGMAADGWRCWFADEAAARRAAARVAGVAGCEVRGLHRLGCEAAAWSWHDAFPPVAVPGFGTIRPAWEEGAATAARDGSTIFIEPGAGFGTGLHETTQLCLAAIAAWAGRGGRLDRVLDVGAGSGILGIAAAVLGAARVDAVEIDLRLHDAIRGNAARNGVADRITVAAEWPPAGPVGDLVVANIVAGVLLDLAAPLAAAVRRDDEGRLAGCVVLSGVLADDVPRVGGAFTARLGVPFLESRRGDWRCLTFAPQESPAGATACR